MSSILMDSDLWNSRLAAAKRHYSMQHQRNSHLDDFEVEEDVRSDFPCPYCYEDYDIASLCSHLEDEHPSESKVTVCTICSVKVSRDMLNHITLQHGHLFKLQRCRRLRRVAIPNSQALTLLGRDLREAHLQVLLGGSGHRSSNANASNPVTDSLLSQLVLNFPASEGEEFSKSAVSIAEEASKKNSTTAHIWKSSSNRDTPVWIVPLNCQTPIRLVSEEQDDVIQGLLLQWAKELPLLLSSPPKHSFSPIEFISLSSGNGVKMHGHQCIHGKLNMLRNSAQ